jgi:hypothetical protein
MPLLVLIEGIHGSGEVRAMRVKSCLLMQPNAKDVRTFSTRISYTFLFFLEVFCMDITADSLKWPQCHSSTLNFKNVIMGVLMNGSPIYKIPGLRIVAHYIPQDRVDAHVRCDVCKCNRKVTGRTLY